MNDLEWWQGLIGGAAGVAVMTMMMRMAAESGMTSMRMPLILGSMFRSRADAARGLGLTIHVMNGVLFGLVYALVFWAFDAAVDDAWWIGAAIGAVHGLSAAAMMPLMSAMHPRSSDAHLEPSYSGEVTLPPFRFGGAGFGAATPIGLIMAHVVFGLTWGFIVWAIA